MPVFEALRAERGSFAELIGYVPLSTSRTTVRHGDRPETAWADMVTGNFFSALGVRMARGVGFRSNVNPKLQRPTAEAVGIH
jgi:hypothetical protein